MAARFSFDFDKALATMVYLSSAGIRDLTKYKICKLVFLADKYHLVRFGRPITGDRLCAMENGPVPSETLNLMNALIQDSFKDDRVAAMSRHLVLDRAYSNPRFSLRQELPLEEFLSASDLTSLEITVAAHGHKSFDELKALTHEMPAYKRAWQGRENQAPTIGYEDLFLEDSDAIEGALQEMIEDDDLRKAFGVL
jgi:uncharacterized phage-associated protein